MPARLSHLDLRHTRSLHDPNTLRQHLTLQLFCLKTYAACMSTLKPTFSQSLSLAYGDTLLIQTYYLIQQAEQAERDASRHQLINLIEETRDSSALLKHGMITCLKKTEPTHVLISALEQFQVCVDGCAHPSPDSDCKSRLQDAMQHLKKAMPNHQDPIAHHFFFVDLVHAFSAVQMGQILFLYSIPTLNHHLAKTSLGLNLVLPASFFPSFAHYTGYLFLSMEWLLAYTCQRYVWTFSNLVHTGLKALIALAPLSQQTKRPLMKVLQSNHFTLLFSLTLLVFNALFISTHSPSFFILANLPYPFLFMYQYYSTQKHKDHEQRLTNPYAALLQSMMQPVLISLYAKALLHLWPLIEARFLAPDHETLLRTPHLCKKFEAACTHAALTELGLFANASERDIIKQSRSLQRQYHPDHNPTKDAAARFGQIKAAEMHLRAHFN